MRRRKFSREFKVEAVKLVKDRGVPVAQAARDLDVHENVMRKWVKEFGSAGPSLPWAWTDEAGAAGDRAAATREQQTQGGAGHFKKLSRAVARLRAVETARAIFALRRVAAVGLLEVSPR